MSYITVSNIATINIVVAAVSLKKKSEILRRFPINPECAQMIAAQISDGSIYRNRDIALIGDQQDDGTKKVAGILPFVPHEYLYGCKEGADSDLNNKAPDKVYFIVVSGICPESVEMYVRGWFIQRNFGSQDNTLILNPVTMNQLLTEVAVWRYVADEINKPRIKPEEKFSEPW